MKGSAQWNNATAPSRLLWPQHVLNTQKSKINHTKVSAQGNNARPPSRLLGPNLMSLPTPHILTTHK